MRYAEFKLDEAKDQPSYYSVGDSHSNGVSNYGRRAGWKAMGRDGSSAYDPMHPAAIKQIPKGSVVVISLGANDLGSQRSVQQIAAQVASVVSLATSQGLKPIVLLPTTTAANKPQDPRRVELSQAIASAVNVPTIPLGQAASSDPQGLHLDSGGYANIAQKVLSVQPAKAVPQQGGLPTADQPSKTSGAFSINVPEVSVGWKGADVMDVQKTLAALGYDLGPKGADGIRGKFTIAAIKKYQADRKLKVDGDAGPETVTALNKDIAATPDKFKSITKSSPSDIKQSSRIGKEYAPQPVAYDAVTKGKIGEVLNFVASKESRGYYDMMNGSVRKPEILKMTIRQANQFQRNWRKTTGNSSAMGRYQIMGIEPTNNTFAYAQKAGLNLDKDLFSPENQDKMGIEFLREKGLDDWLNGQMKDKDFLHGLSRVWAAIPDPRKGGRSHYDKVGNNKAGMSTDYALNSLQNIRTG
jgi:peptidoglycan hydrolase-like protein with peptidoglycan-binding domain